MAPLTVTANREAVIDFTKAYYEIELRVLYNILEDDDQVSLYQLFKFLEPFDPYLWLLILISAIVVSVGMAIIGKLSPYDWHRRPPKYFSTWESEFQMTFYNSVWQSLGAVLQQGNVSLCMIFVL